MIGFLVVVGSIYLVAALAVCGWIGYGMAGARGLTLGLLFGPLGLLICVLVLLTDRLGSDLGNIDEAIGHLDHAMASLMPWGRARPRRPSS